MRDSVWHDIQMGFSQSKTVFKAHKQGFFTYLVFMMTTFFGSLVFIFSPIFILADMHVGMQVHESKTLKVEDAFDDSQRLKTVWTTVLVMIILGMIVVGFSAILVGLYYGLQMYGRMIDDFMNYDRYYMSFIGQIITYVLGGILLFLVQMYFESTLYLILKNPESKLSDIVHQNNEMMKSQGFIQLFVIKVIYFGQLLIILAFLSSIGYYVYPMLTRPLFYLLVLLLLMIFLRFVPKLYLGYRLSSIQLFSRRLENASYVRLIDNKTPLFSDQIRKEDILKALFDEVIEPTPVEEPIDESQKLETIVEAEVK